MLVSRVTALALAVCFIQPGQAWSTTCFVQGPRWVMPRLLGVGWKVRVTSCQPAADYFIDEMGRLYPEEMEEIEVGSEEIDTYLTPKAEGVVVTATVLASRRFERAPRSKSRDFRWG